MTMDIIYIHDLRIETVIGIYEWESQMTMHTWNGSIGQSRMSVLQNCLGPGKIIQKDCLGICGTTIPNDYIWELNS